MAEIQENSIMNELISEVETYLPDMKSYLHTLTQDTSDKDVVSELFRMTHTIKGAASMVRLQVLSDTAALMEQEIDNIMKGQQTWSPQLINVMTDTVEQISVYCNSITNGKEGDAELYKKTLSAFEQIIDAPQESPDEVNIAELLGDDDDDSTDDFFSQFSDEEGTTDLEDEIAGFFDASGDDDVDITLDSSAPGNLLPETFTIDPELQESFDKEAEEHLENIGQQLNTLSASVTDRTSISEENREKLHSIRRSVHTLKGAAAVIGIESVADWGHSFEDFLDWLHDESNALSPEIIIAMLDGSDLLETIADNPAVDVNHKIAEIKNTFQTIIGASTQVSNEKEIAEVNDELANLLNIFDEAEEDIALNSSSEENQPPETFAIAPELQESFDEEAEEHLENIGQQLNTLSASVTGLTPISEEYREKLLSIRRSVHTLKGAAAVIGIEPVADWGHEFEDFLDWLHDESGALSPEIITVMLNGTDILEKVADTPSADVSSSINRIQETFKTIMAGSTVITDNTDSVDTTKEQTPVTSFTEKIETEIEDTSVKIAFPVKATQPSPSKDLNKTKDHRKRSRKKTLRVETDKIDGVMGLIGDMTINLSGFENSRVFMESTLAELGTTLERLKVIASNLESGYELSSIPHLGAMGRTSQAGNDVTEEFDPLEMDRYSELHILIRSLNEAVVDLDSIKNQSYEVHDSWRHDVNKQRRVLGEVQSTMKNIQMTPFSTLSNRLYKAVRESSKATEKAVRLSIEGGTIEMDSRVWELLAAPLMHMLRNAVDHGIENKQERQQTEKPGQATITINCSRTGSRFVLRISDDGKGLDHEVIRKRAVQLYPGTGVEEMDNRELAGLIFKQGFSIKTQISTLSGRGVGMDVVRDAIEQLHGSIDVVSHPGEGTSFILSMPITVAQLPVLMVKFGEQQFAVPMHDINRVFRLSSDESKQDEYAFEDETVPLLHPAEILRLKNSKVPSANITNPAATNPLAIAIDVGGRHGVLVTDTIIGKSDVIFKNLGSHLKNVPCISGATILGDGTLVPILQTEDLFTRAEMSSGVHDDNAVITSDREDRTLTVLIVDDSISIRKVLTNFINDQGWNPTTAHDGMDAMEKIRENKPDLVLLDIEMPRMNGFEVLQSLQLQSAYRDIPVVMLTSRSASKYRDKATRLGARGFATKPFKDEDVISLITSLTGKTVKG